jgi:hypothetical protein
MTRTASFPFTLTLLCLLAAAGPAGRCALAQDVELIRHPDDSTRFLVAVDGRVYLPIPEDSARVLFFRLDSLRLENRALQRTLEAQRKLTATYEEAVATYEEHDSLQDSLIGELRGLYTGYRDLNQLYRRAYSEPWLSVQGGLGTVWDRNDGDGASRYLPAVLLGVSVRRFSLWGYFNNEQTGFIVGINYPLRLFF